MGIVHDNWRVLSAMLVSVVVIVGAYILARGVEDPPVAQASSELEILHTLAGRDADEDGLPDWEEALYGADPSNPDTFDLGITDGQAVAQGLVVPRAIADAPPAATSSPASSIPLDPSLPPPPADGTLTSVFAENFFSLYSAAKEANGGGVLSQEDIANIASDALAGLASSVAPAPDFKVMDDLTISGSGVDALTTFAAEAETVLARNAVYAKESEITYFKHALEGRDLSAYERMSSIASGYRVAAAGLAALTVPEELAQAHLELVNAFMHLSQTISDMTRAEIDPLTAMLALQQYPSYVTALANAFADVYQVYVANDAIPTKGTPGALFVSVAPRALEADQTMPLSEPK